MNQTATLLAKSIYSTVLILFIGIFSAVSAQPLEGDYTINSAEPTAGTNFASFGDFATALSSEGISGHVNATVTPDSGPYEEQVVFENVVGSGPDAVISIFGNGETLTALTDTDNRYLLRLSGMSYVTIENLNLVRNPDAASGFYGIHVFGSGSNITIFDCHVDMAGTTSTLVGGYICSGSETSILSAGDFHDINIVENSTNGGGYGASVYGEVGNLSTNILISGNDFQNFNSNGVYLRETDAVAVSNNYFDRNAGTVSSCNAIQLAQANNINGNIFNNIIEHTQTNNGTMTFRGIYVFDGTGHSVYNNVIQNILLESGDVSAIEVRSANTSTAVSFNTISIDHSSPSSGDLFGIAESLSNTTMILRNNNISIQQSTSGNAAGLVLGNLTNLSTGIDSDYNNIYVPDGNVALQGVFSPSLYPALANWQTGSQQDENSASIDPQFTAIDLTIPTNSAMNDLGITLPDIGSDILGNVRNDPPDMGAYEFSGCDFFEVDEIDGDSVVCIGEEADFGITLLPGEFTVHWSVEGDASIIGGQGEPLATILFEGGDAVVSVAVENECGIGPEASLNVTVNDLPNDVPEIFGPTEVCAGDFAVDYSVDPQEGTDNFVWDTSADSEFFYGFISTLITVNFGDSTTVVSVTPQNECGSGNTTEITVTVNPLPDVQLEFENDVICETVPVVILEGGIPGGGTYSGPGVTGNEFIPSEAGLGTHTITYSYTVKTGCSASATDEIEVTVCPGIEEESEDALMTVFPNPFHNILQIELHSSHKGPADVRIFDINGKMVWESPVQINPGEQHYSFSVENIKAGMYLLTLTNEKVQFQHPLVRY